MSLDLATVKNIYRQAVDARAHDAEGEAWWSEVATEVRAVVAAPRGADAAAIIAWWHNDWSAIDDTAMDAAPRIRTAAALVTSEH